VSVGVSHDRSKRGIQSAQHGRAAFQFKYRRRPAGAAQTFDCAPPIQLSCESSETTNQLEMRRNTEQHEQRGTKVDIARQAPSMANCTEWSQFDHSHP
jgi:hypothetical protein